ncbi:hypothetical protein pb186bvf_008869 [Paramecium bursaria]
MGITCSSKKSPKITNATQTETRQIRVSTMYYDGLKTLSTKFIRIVSLFDYFDIKDAREYLNELVMIRSLLQLERGRRIETLLIKSLQFIKALQRIEEFDYYYPILSQSLWDLSLEIEEYIKTDSRKSTKLSIQSACQFKE